MLLMRSSVVLLFILLSGCASVPPEVAQAHQKELEIIETLKASHLAMVDAYIDQKLIVFEEFFFDTYGIAYLTNWKSDFKNDRGRAYEEKKDFSILYADLVVEYQEAIQPITTMRHDLKQSITAEFTNAIQTHKAINAWIKSINSLKGANTAVLDKILEGIKPGLSLDAIDAEIAKSKKVITEKFN
ncbi:MAG: hypothetical protein ACJA13_003523 [Paraglaciecola sp.]|jgi:hypothetical protein